MLRWTLALAMTFAIGCENEGENGSLNESSGSSSSSGKSGFSADLAKEMGDGKKGEPNKVDAMKKSDGKKPEDEKAPEKKDETKKVAVDDGKKPDEVKKDDGKKPDETKKDDGKKPDEVKKDDGKKPDETKKDDGKKPDETKKDDAKKDDTKKVADDTKKPDETKKDDTKKVADDTKKPDEKKVDPKNIPAQPDPTGPRVQLKPTGELATIKLSLLPNWDRDVGEVGTISFDLKVPGKSEKKIFVFHYGIESAQVPLDRDAYKKWLEKEGILKDIKDRQRGGAWLLEGTDASGAPAFRMVVNYSKRLLICYGSMYRDAASNALTDLRDQTIIQAKQICETITL